MVAVLLPLLPAGASRYCFLLVLLAAGAGAAGTGGSGFSVTATIRNGKTIDFQKFLNKEKFITRTGAKT